MAKIPLRMYNKKIENLIERGEIDEAIAHSKNILQKYPKYIDTYRLLGKAFLESQRYAEAADILQRVLSVFPDDFVSQIGMSIIREDEGNLDASIWHMERAYEVQPFNPAVQDELRRLYGRRDGVEPPKIRLTRGALVRMYTRSDLFPQATAEIRAALAEDPQRIDLQVQLARIYFQTGQRIEATECCSTIIGKLPYCYEANRILANILPGTSRAEDARVFQQRLVALDPYEAFLSPTAATSDLVPDQSVSMEESILGTTSENNQTPDWTRTAGVEWKQPPDEELPGWLNNLAPDQQSEISTVEPSGTSPAQAPTPHKADQPGETLTQEPPASDAASAIPNEDVIPDWMKTAGWQASNRSLEGESTPAASDEMAEEPVAPAEIPDWLTNLAPASPGISDVEEERLSWLDSILPNQDSINEQAAPDQTEALTQENTQQPSPQVSGPEETDWSSAFVPSSPESEAADSQTEDIPEWLRELAPSNEEQAADQGDIPDWLSELAPSAAEKQGQGVSAESSDQIQPVQQAPEQIEKEAQVVQEVQDESGRTAPTPTTRQFATESLGDQPAITQPVSVKSSEPEIPSMVVPVEEAATQDETAPVALPTSVEPATPDFSDMDVAMAWLESLAAKQGADPSTLTTQPAQPTVTPPQELPHPITEQEQHPPVEAAPQLPGPQEQPLDSSQAEIGNLVGTPSGLIGVEPIIEEKPPVPVESTAGPAPAVEENIPGLKSEVPTEITPPATQAAPSMETPVQGQPEVAGEDMDSAMAWLESLAAKQGAEEGTLSTPSEMRRETPPDWLTQEIADQVAEPEQAGESAIPVVAETPPEPVSAQSVDELPDWLKMDESPSEPLELAEPSPALQGSEPAEASTPDLNDMDSAMAWLESLAAKQGADEETLTTTPEERTETPPEWLTQEISSQVNEPVQDEQKPVPVDTTQIPAGTQPLSPFDMEEKGTSLPSFEEETANEAFTDFEDGFVWLESLAAKQGAEEGTLSTAPGESEASTPAWIQNETPQAEETPLPVDIGKPQPEASAISESTQGLLESAKEATDLQGFEPSQEPIEKAVQDDTLTQWLQGLENETEIQDTDREAGEIYSAPGKDEVASQWLPVEESIQPPETTNIPTDSQIEITTLVDAQAALSHGNLESAISYYNTSIQRGDQLDEVVHDLRDALYRYPVDITLWQTLGDAFSRNNQLQEALDAYTKAEELLR